eukprot:6597628-Pyramimonas_sp.AAC.1
MGIREILAHVLNGCAPRYSENHTLNMDRSQSVKLLQVLEANVRRAKAGTTFSKPPGLNP